VRTEPKPGLVAADGQRRHGKPTLEDRLVARMLARWLDEELASDVGPWVSAAHDARTTQLTGERMRRAVVHTLDRLVDRAQNPRPVSRIPLVAPCGEQVQDAMPVIRSIRGRLLSGEPLSAPGIARLKILLSDRQGPFYVPGQRNVLTVALREISELLGSGESARAN
jgi:hypothetical protein